MPVDYCMQKTRYVLILGIDEDGSVVLARSSSLSWKISKGSNYLILLNVILLLKNLKKIKILFTEDI